MTPTLQVTNLTIRRDNHVWFFPTRQGGVAVVDPGEAEPVQAFLTTMGWDLSHILLTHHHNDHQGGAASLRHHYQAVLVGAAADSHRLPQLDQAVKEGDTITLGLVTAQVLETPGHTLGHVVYRLADALFTGDTLFHAGCGRLFEGTAQQMFHSLQKLSALPGSLRIFPGHEYSLNNLEFLLHLDEKNELVKNRMQEVKQMLDAGRITTPILLDYERKINPFLNCLTSEVAKLLHMEGEDGVAVFAALRQLRNTF